MGMDLLDIRFRIEKTFDIDLSVDDLAALVHDEDITVGSLYILVLQRKCLRDAAKRDLRLNYDLWMEIEHVLQSVTEASHRIEPQTPLNTLFPRKGRRARWDILRDACRYRVEKLEYPMVVSVVGALLAVGMASIEQFPIWRIGAAKWLWPLLGILGIAMFVESYWKILSICAPLRKCFPGRMVTVKDFFRVIVAENYTEICAGSGVCCNDVHIDLDERCLNAWWQLTQVLVDVLAVDADEVSFECRLVRDLGMS